MIIEDDMIITMEIKTSNKPRRGEINVTPARLGYISIDDFYNLVIFFGVVETPPFIYL